MSNAYKAVLFDLDGTINDSSPGITNSVRFALDRLGCPPMTEPELRRFVGPSLYFSFTNYAGLDDERAERAIELYRECYGGGELYNLKIYDGMPELLAALPQYGLRAALVTSKPALMADRILDHFDTRKYFSVVTAPSPSDHSSDKSVLIRQALERLELAPDEAIMVGDTRFDILGAAKAGCDSVGVTYGCGSRSELVESGATFLADSPDDLRPILGLPPRNAQGEAK